MNRLVKVIVIIFLLIGFVSTLLMFVLTYYVQGCRLGEQCTSMAGLQIPHWIPFTFLVVWLAAIIGYIKKKPTVSIFLDIFLLISFLYVINRLK